jgi:hypothetical protein
MNEAIYKYQFTVPLSQSFSLDIMKNMNATAGMTVETKPGENFKICDKNKNCMDMNIENGLNIYPSSPVSQTINNVNNIYLYDKTKTKVLANFDLENNAIFLGSNGEDAGMYIKGSNVYLKNLNFINGNFADSKTLFNKNLIGVPQTYNTYPFNINDIYNKTKITGIYSITKGTDGTNPQNVLIINFKSSNDIPIQINTLTLA